jgi:DNA-binding IclR family transcriptional regulator
MANGMPPLAEELNDPLATNDRITVLDRVSRLLNCFLSTDAPELGIRELARATEMGGGTTHRLVTELERHRFLEQNPETRRYRLGMKLLELGGRAIANISYSQVAEPSLQSLARETGETSHMAIMCEETVLYVAKVEGWHSLRMPSHLGERQSLHCTALGKCLLAFLDESLLEEILLKLNMNAVTANTITDPREFRKTLSAIAARGFAVDREELELGLCCVAAPVFDYSGTVVAAISISGPSNRINRKTIPELAQRVVASAQTVSAGLGSSSALKMS